jgi:peptidoglycan/LPS O-acetylase OafA/YrhL
MATFGGDGLTLFFSISGFLITTLLLRELSARGAISIRDFYRRRVFRILPAAFTCLAVGGDSRDIRNHYAQTRRVVCGSVLLRELLALSRLGRRALVPAFCIAAIIPIWRLARAFPMKFPDDQMHRTDYRLDTFGIACGLAIIGYYQRPAWLKSLWSLVLGCLLRAATLVLPHSLFLKPVASALVVAGAASQPDRVPVRIPRGVRMRPPQLPVH